MIISVVNGKGGVGKSTVSALLASTLHRAEHSVGVVDRDPQQSLANWVASHEEPGFELATEGQKYDHVIIDTPPRIDAEELKDSVRRSDLVLVVVTSSPLDAQATIAAAPVIKASLKRNGRACCLFTQVSTRSVLDRSLPQIAKLTGFPKLKSTLGMRTCYRTFFIDGWRALTPPAREELYKLSLECLRK